jgi:group II intron reverse transcriptase/maturase
LTDKLEKVQALRNLEYYGLQTQFDDLYKKSKQNLNFNHLMGIITSKDNIMLVYRNIKSNKGSQTPSEDKKTIKDIEKLSQNQFFEKVQKEFLHYYPRIVRRKEIPKPNGKTRPLGIPSIWDRIIQQCILQVLEPICEAKFFKDSYGFRPNHSAEHAIAKSETYINRMKLYYVVDVDIKGFFDEVCHTKLMRQLWTMGIHDKQLLVILRKILKAPIKMPNGSVVYPRKGTPQGGVLSPLLANVNLNEFDHWIERQWATRELPNIQPQFRGEIRSYGHEYRYLRKKTKLKPMYIVRYADDFKIFTTNRSNAEKIFKAVTMWLDERLKLPISIEKSKVTNLKKEYSEFLGFKLKARKKGKRRVAETHISDKALKVLKHKLKEQVKTIQKTGTSVKAIQEINRYNSMVIGLHNYYGIANHVNLDLAFIGWKLDIMMYHRFQKAGAKKKQTEQSTGYTAKGNYNGKDKGILQYTRRRLKYMRYYMKRPILPIADIRARSPMQKKRAINKYTVKGRKLIHKKLEVTSTELEILRNSPLENNHMNTVQMLDNRIALYIAQKGKCPISGQELLGNHHLHHKKLWSETHDDSYKNLILISKEVHRLIHATKTDTVEHYFSLLNLDKVHLEKLNKLRQLVGNPTLKAKTRNG